MVPFSMMLSSIEAPRYIKMQPSATLMMKQLPYTDTDTSTHPILSSSI